MAQLCHSTAISDKIYALQKQTRLSVEFEHFAHSAAREAASREETTWRPPSRNSKSSYRPSPSIKGTQEPIPTEFVPNEAPSVPHTEQTIRLVYLNPHRHLMRKSKKASNHQEPTQSDPSSCPENQKGNN